MLGQQLSIQAEQTELDGGSAEIHSQNTCIRH